MRRGYSYYRSTSSGEGIPAWAGWFLIAVGLFLVFCNLRLQTRLAFFGARADGVLENFSPYARAGQYRVRFHLPSGEEVRFRTTVLFSRRMPSRPEVRVSYLPSKPTFAEIDSFKQLWSGVLLGHTVGWGLAYGGFAIVRSARRRGGHYSEKSLLILR